MIKYEINFYIDDEEDVKLLNLLAEKVKENPFGAPTEETIVILMKRAILRELTRESYK